MMDGLTPLLSSFSVIDCGWMASNVEIHNRPGGTINIHVRVVGQVDESSIWSKSSPGFDCAQGGSGSLSLSLWSSSGQMGSFSFEPVLQRAFWSLHFLQILLCCSLILKSLKWFSPKSIYTQCTIKTDCNFFFFFSVNSFMKKNWNIILI